MGGDLDVRVVFAVGFVIKKVGWVRWRPASRTERSEGCRWDGCRHRRCVARFHNHDIVVVALLSHL
jgi:hypothetical protein